MDSAIDLYAETDEFDNFGGDGMMDQGQDAGVDLYNDLGGDGPSESRPSKVEADHSMPEADDTGFHGGQSGQSGTGRRYSIILGNLTWWTSDDDLQELIDSYGIPDLVDIRIHENRANGQSKGFAIVTVGSEESSRYLINELPKKELQGQTPVVVPFSRQALQTFDAQSRKNEGGSGRNNPMQQNTMMNGGQMRPGMGMGPQNMAMNRAGMGDRPRLPGMPGMPPRLPGMPMPGMPRFPMGMGIPGAMGMGMRPFPPGLRPGMGGMMRPDRPMGMGMDWDPTGAAAFGMGMGGMGRMPVPGLPAPHVNPAFFAGQAAAAAAFGGMQGQQGFDQSGDMSGTPGLSLVPGTEDYENLISQMKEVARNAIAKAASECKTDPSGALSKLESALLILSSSKVSDEERVQRTIKSLQEAIEDVRSTKNVSETRNGDRHSRERERSRDRHERDRRDRDRERESSRRDRRSRSRSHERRRSSDRDRESRSTRDRDRDRERDRDRRRESDRDRRDSDRERDRHR